MTRALVLLLIWMLQMVLVLLLVDADWIQRQLRAEQATTAAHFGVAQYGRLHAGAESDYARWFVDTRVVESSYQRFLPDPDAPRKNRTNVAPWFFKWMEARLDALWWLMYQAVHRLEVIGAWGIYLCVLLAVGAVDGIARWKVKCALHRAPSSDRYLIARHALLFLSFAPLFYFFLPLQLHPIAVPLWACAFALALMLFGANLQHRV